MVVATPANCGWVGKWRIVGAVRCRNLQWELSCPMVVYRQ